MIGQYADQGDGGRGDSQPGQGWPGQPANAAPTPGVAVPTPAAAVPEPAEVRTGHPAVDAELRAMANAVNLPPDDQIAQYEATHQVLRETLGTIDEG